MALVITRRVGEMFYVGDDVQVRVLEIKGNQVRIGITAPDHVAIHRSEIYAKIQKQKLWLEELDTNENIGNKRR